MRVPARCGAPGRPRARMVRARQRPNTRRSSANPSAVPCGTRAARSRPGSRRARSAAYRLQRCVAIFRRRTNMPETRLDGTRVAIIANEWFEQSEMQEPRKALDAAGAKTVLISTKPGEIQARSHGDKGDRFTVDMTLDDAWSDDFDAVLLPGGTLNADKLRMEERARGFVREMQAAGKPIAAICHAPWLLVSAGLVKGRTLTSFYTLQDDIRNAGGTWRDEEVVRDRNWVTSRQPADIPSFNRAMIELFASAVPARTR